MADPALLQKFRNAARLIESDDWNAGVHCLKRNRRKRIFPRDQRKDIGDAVKRTDIAAVASHVECTSRLGALDLGRQPFAQARIDATEPDEVNRLSHRA